MKTVKDYITFSFLLIVYVVAISLLLQQFYMYQRAYQSLSRLISHPTVFINDFEEKGSGGLADCTENSDNHYYDSKYILRSNNDLSGERKEISKPVGRNTGR